MKVIRMAFIVMALAVTSCSNDDGMLVPNDGYTTIQQKALAVLHGTWVSNEITVKYELYGGSVEMMVVPSDTLIFLSQYPAPQSFYAYDYLQGKETEIFVTCGTCELRVGSGTIPYFTPACYFYVSSSGDELNLYNVETEQQVRSYNFRAESATRFYAGSYNGSPIIFNKQQP